MTTEVGQSLFSFAEARAELERLQGQQEGIENVIGVTRRGEAIRTVLAAYDSLNMECDRLVSLVKTATTETFVTTRYMPTPPWDPATGPPPEIVIQLDSMVAQMPCDVWSDIVFAAVGLEVNRGD